MLYSIIIPIYNVERYLPECIESVIKQSYKNFELILVDDGSTDKSSAICDKYASLDSRVKVLHKKNEGVAIARKMGTDNAKGEYIAFVDADDFVVQDYLKRIDEIINLHSVDIIKFGLKRERKNGDVYIKMPQFNGLFQRKRIESDVFPILIQDEKAGYLSANLFGVFRSSIIKPFMIANPHAKIGEDSACVIPAITHSNSIFFLNEALYFYRYNFSSATKNHKVFDWDNPEIVARHISEHIDINSFDFRQQVSRRVVHDVFNVAVTRFYQKKSFFNICKEIRKEFNRPFYIECANQAKFKNNLKAQLMHFCVKKSLKLPIFIFSKMKICFER